MGKVTISRQLIETAMRARTTRKALDARRDAIAARARQIATSEGVKTEVRTESGTRPKGRPYARVLSSNRAAEWGDSKTARRRVLGRAR